MRIALVSGHVPLLEGSASGRALRALGDGLVADGHDVTGWTWAPTPPGGELPPWCDWRPLPAEAAWRTRGRALLRPRHDVLRAGWRAPDGAVAIADEPLSWPAVAQAEHAAATFHYLTRLDAAALDRRRPRDVQDVRHERRVARSARLVLAYSQRVARRAARGSRVVPIAYPMPAAPIEPVDEPVAVLLAGWHWPPNVVALDLLLSCWPDVRARVPGARLVIGGRRSERLGIGAVTGVDVIGEVASSSELLASAALVAFPCPATSGPKVKVLEALAHGVPVVTTPPGVEGLVLPPASGAVVAARPDFAAALAGLLADPARRACLGASGRAAVLAHHAPLPAARTRVAVLEEAFGR